MVYAHDQRLQGHSSEIETNIDPLNICPSIDHNQKNRGAHNLANKLLSPLLANLAASRWLFSNGTASVSL